MRAAIGPWAAILCCFTACMHDRVDLGQRAPEVLGGGGQAGPQLKPLRPPPQAPSVLLPAPPPTQPSSTPMPPPLAPPTRLSLVHDMATPPAISGGTLRVVPDGSIAVAADPDRDQVYVVQLSTDSVQTLTLPKGSEPGRVALDGSGRAHVVLRSAGKLAQIDIASGQLMQTADVCQFPRGAAFDARRGELVVACASGELVTLDPATYALHGSQQLAVDLRDVVMSPSGKRFVSRYRSAELLQLDDQGSVASRSRPKVLNVVRALPPGSVSTSATQAWRTIAGPDGMPWMLHQRSDDVDGGAKPSESYSDAANPCSAITRPSMTHYDEQGTPVQSMHLGRSITLAVDHALSADGRLMALADPAAYLRTNPSVTVLVTQAVQSTGNLVRSDGAPVDAPQHCAIEQVLGLAEDSQATSVAFDADGRLYILSRTPAQLDIVTLAHSDDPAAVPSIDASRTVVLSDTGVRDTGHDLFHVDVGSGIACASCHGEALDDGHVWDIGGFGPRRTQGIRGGILQTLPLHWEGELAGFPQLVSEVMVRRMNGFGVDAQYAEALGKWIDGLPALSLTDNPPAGAEHGKQLFESAELRCTECHSGPARTNNQTVDVGTGRAFQVPALRGLALHAPYMHNGCAATLAQRFDPDCGGGEQHGHTSQLSPEDLADLIAYLETL